MVKHDPKKYTIMVKYGNYDGEDCYIGSAKEFKDVLVFGETPEQVYHEVVSVVDGLIDLAIEMNKPYPAPTKWIR